MSTKNRYGGQCKSSPQIVFRDTGNLPIEMCFSLVAVRHRLCGSCPSRNSRQTPRINFAPGRWHLGKEMWGRKVTFSLRPSITEFKNKQNPLKPLKKKPKKSYNLCKIESKQLNFGFGYLYKWPCSRTVCCGQHPREVWVVQDGAVATIMVYMKIGFSWKQRSMWLCLPMVHAETNANTTSLQRPHKLW